MVQLALDLRDPSPLYLLVEHHCSLPLRLFQPLLRLLLAQLLQHRLFLLHDCALRLYLHLLELPFDLAVKVVERRGGEKGDAGSIVFFVLGKVQSILLSVEFDYANPFVSLLLRDPISRLSLYLQLLLQRKLLDLLRFGMQEFLREARADDFLVGAGGLAGTETAQQIFEFQLLHC